MRTRMGKKGKTDDRGRKIRHNLSSRQAAWDEMSTEAKRGTTRPGSTNSHKQA